MKDQRILYIITGVLLLIVVGMGAYMFGSSRNSHYSGMGMNDEHFEEMHPNGQMGGGRGAMGNHGNQ